MILLQLSDYAHEYIRFFICGIVDRQTSTTHNAKMFIAIFEKALQYYKQTYYEHWDIFYFINVTCKVKKQRAI